MEDINPPSSWFTVTNLVTAQALADPEIRRVLAPFIKAEHTIKEAALELGLGLNATLYRTRRLEKLGLLHITREEARKGRAIRHYQAVAKGFFIPYTASPFETPDAWLVEDYRSRELRLAKGTMQSGLAWGEARGQTTFGKRIFLRNDGILKADFAFSFEQGADLLETDAPAVASYFIETDLSEEDAKVLQHELAQLVRRFERRGKGKRYLLRLGLAFIEE